MKLSEAASEERDTKLMKEYSTQLESSLAEAREEVVEAHSETHAWIDKYKAMDNARAAAEIAGDALEIQLHEAREEIEKMKEAIDARCLYFNDVERVYACIFCGAEQPAEAALVHSKSCIISPTSGG